MKPSPEMEDVMVMCEGRCAPQAVMPRASRPLESKNAIGKLMNQEPFDLIVLEDDPAHVTAILRSFREADPLPDIRVANTLEEYCAMVAERAPDIAVIDLNLPDGNTMEALSLLSEESPFPVLVMTSCGNEEVAVAALKAGALDYLVKSPEVFAAMPRAVQRVRREWRLIQSHRQAEERLRASEMLQKDVLNSLPAHIAVLDSEGAILSVNEPWLHFARSHGAGSVEHLGVGSNYLSVCRAASELGDCYAKAALLGLQAVLAGKQDRFSLEYPCDDPATQRWFAMEVLKSSGSSAAAIVSHTDITVRKQIERARESQRLREARWLSIAEAAHDAIFWMNAGGQITFWNPAAQSLFGYGEVEVLGKSWREILAPAGEKGRSKALEEALVLLSDGKALGRPVEMQIPHRAGHAISVVVSLWTVGLDSDWYTVGIVRDVTGLKRLETEILSISDKEQHRIGQDLHDGLGQQLTALEMKCYLLLDDLNAEDLSASREKLRRQVQGLSQSLQDCVKSTRAISYSLAPVQLGHEGLGHALSQLAYRASVPGKLECRFAGSGHLALDERTAMHLYRIAQEAVHNAVRHSATSQIDIRLTGGEAALCLEVQDYGNGLPASGRRTTGLGMQGMAHRATVIGAHLEIDSSPGDGVTCRVTMGWDRPAGGGF